MPTFSLIPWRSSGVTISCFLFPHSRSVLPPSFPVSFSSCELENTGFSTSPLLPGNSISPLLSLSPSHSSAPLSLSLLLFLTIYSKLSRPWWNPSSYHDLWCSPPPLPLLPPLHWALPDVSKHRLDLSGIALNTHILLPPKAAWQKCILRGFIVFY